MPIARGFRISMSSTAKYVTQSSVWDNQYLGPITDRTIAKHKATCNSAGILLPLPLKIKKVKTSKRLAELFANF